MKSTNIIFYDNIGINELFGDFLTQMNLSLSDIVTAVKYVGQYLSYDTLKQFSFNNKSKQVNNRYGLHEHRLSLYQYNAEIYAGWKWNIFFSGYSEWYFFLFQCGNKSVQHKII